MYDSILLATDGSPPSRAATEHAVALAQTFDADLHAVSVVDTMAIASLDQGSAAVEEALEREAEEALEWTRERAKADGVFIETEVRYGSPHREIVDVIEESGADAVVMGTHGRRGLDHLLMGSVAERVVRASPVPVLTVRGEQD